MRNHKQENAFIVDGDEHLAQREAVDASVDDILDVATCLGHHLEAIKLFVKVSVDQVVNHLELRLFVCLDQILLLLL